MGRGLQNQKPYNNKTGQGKGEDERRGKMWEREREQVREGSWKKRTTYDNTTVRLASPSLI